ncbi:MAG: exodeoxyribonuclease V subunit alpha [Aquisalimonadaceae bacterium]
MKGPTQPDLWETPVERALASPQGMLDLLERWVARGWLRALDWALVRFLHEGADGAQPLLLLAAALTSHQLGRGHVCLDLEATLDNADLTLSLPPEDDDGNAPPPRPSECLAQVSLKAWLHALNHAVLVADGEGATPLVCVDTRLYLRRYWRYEQRIRMAIGQRLGRLDAELSALPAEADLRRRLQDFFPDPAHLGGVRTTDWQKVACALAARSAFTVITGGPGTGKTTTVVRLLGLLQTLAQGGEDPDNTGRALRIRLAAPTGKAAARLNESIAGAVRALPLPANAHGERIRAAIPTEAATLHRLLGSLPATRHFRHNRRNPLPVDVLVVDEASMVDVEMMAQLLDALPVSARLILLGDKDQLASVEAGAVLGDLCQRAAAGHYTPATRNWLQAMTGETIAPEFEDAQGRVLDQSMVMLRVSHRFAGGSGIGRLAERVNAGDAAGVQAMWREPVAFADLMRLAVRGEADTSLEKLAVDGGAERFPDGGQGRVAVDGRPVAPPVGYRHYLTVMREHYPGDDAGQDALDDWARAVLAAHGRFQLLCALRRGPWGVEGLNRRIAGRLRDGGLIGAGEQWYPGRPVLVTRNDYGLGLMNGDVGIALDPPRLDADGRRVLRVAFLAGDGSNRIKWILPSRLNDVETVYAMTVHKSQGSEFAHTALVLPDRPSPIVTRELVYTGITRARHWFSLITPADGVLEDAVSRRVQRVSGLFSALNSVDRL